MPHHQRAWIQGQEKDKKSIEIVAKLGGISSSREQGRSDDS